MPVLTGQAINTWSYRKMHYCRLNYPTVYEVVKIKKRTWTYLLLYIVLSLKVEYFYSMDRWSYFGSEYFFDYLSSEKTEVVKAAASNSVMLVSSHQWKLTKSGAACTCKTMSQKCDKTDWPELFVQAMLPISTGSMT